MGGCGCGCGLWLWVVCVSGCVAIWVVMGEGKWVCGGSGFQPLWGGGVGGCVGLGWGVAMQVFLWLWLWLWVFVVGLAEVRCGGVGDCGVWTGQWN